MLAKGRTAMDTEEAAQQSAISRNTRRSFSSAKALVSGGLFEHAA